MKSTGECLGIAKTFHEALYKAFLGAGINLPKHKKMVMTVKKSDREEAVGLGKRLIALGYEIYATEGTAKALSDKGVPATVINKIDQGSPNLLDLILSHEIDMVINTPTQGRDKTRDGFLIRRTSIETGVTCFTALDTASALLTSMECDNSEITLVDVAQL
jgi:carbamoyl-phosphate synthase large subunit